MLETSLQISASEVIFLLHISYFPKETKNYSIFENTISGFPEKIVVADPSTNSLNHLRKLKAPL